MCLRYRILLLSSVLLSGSILLSAQSVKRNKLIVAYVYSFIKNIEWKEEKEAFVIRVISADTDLINEFQFLGSSRKINGKPITITSTKSAIVPSETDVVFVSPEYQEAVPSLYNQIYGQEVLLITDGMSNQRFVMINFLSDEGQKLLFEINSANIINQNLKILPDMVLLGGNDVDVAKLYKEAQGSVRALESRISQLESRYDSLSTRIYESRKTILDQSIRIDEQTDEIYSKQATINRQSELLDSIGNEFYTSKTELDSLRGVLTSTELSLRKLRKDAETQSWQIQEGRKVLESQRVLINQQDQDIQQRESRLQEMVSTVDSQQNALMLLILFSVVVVVFALLIFRAYSARKKDARKLSAQKEELRELLAELQETQAQLVQSEKMASLGVLTAGIAHEINNAINFVYSGIHIIENKFDEIKPVINRVKELNSEDKKLKSKIEKLIKEKEEIKYSEAQDLIAKMIQNIQIGAERTTEIVKGLRTFSRSESEEKVEVDIHQDLEVSLLLLHSRHRDTIEIKKKFANNIPKIRGYQGQLGQAFLNIISNAIDAVEEKGGKAKITITTSLKRKNITISIKDNGIGMTQESVDKIFDPFFTTKKVGSGTGLGLSITFGIIEKHGGTIQVTSSVNAGAEFIINLPLVSDLEPA